MVRELRARELATGTLADTAAFESDVASSRRYDDAIPSASDEVYGDENRIPDELRPTLMQGDPSRLAQLVLGHPRLREDLYRSIQRTHGNAKVNAVIQIASNEGEGRQQSATSARAERTVVNDTHEELAGTLWAKDEAGTDLAPSLDDISQGLVSDCFLFAAMAAIVTANPDLIRQMIQDNGDGTYNVTFKGVAEGNGATHKVTARLLKGKHGKVHKRGALWPLILEKAYAREKGGIEAIANGGRSAEAVRDLANMDFSTFDPRTKDAAWVLAKLAQAKAAHKPITIGATKDQTDAKIEMQDTIAGLYFWHAYAVTDVDVQGQRVKLYNPYGRNHPNGDGWLDIKFIQEFFVEVRINQ